MSTFYFIVAILAFMLQSWLIYRKLKSERAEHLAEIGELSENYLAVCQENEIQEQKIDHLTRERDFEREAHTKVVVLQQHRIAYLEGEVLQIGFLLEAALDPSVKLTQERAREMFAVRSRYPIRGDQERVHQERPLQGPLRPTEEQDGSLQPDRTRGLQVVG